jgi:hypothetical protein
MEVKAFERRMSKDVGTDRIPVTGERHGADCVSGPFCYQFKLRKIIPRFLFEWLDGICLSALKTERIGVMVLKTPRLRDADALVVLRWKDWVDLHGRYGAAQVVGRHNETPAATAERHAREDDARTKTPLASAQRDVVHPECPFGGHVWGSDPGCAECAKRAAQWAAK